MLTETEAGVKLCPFIRYCTNESGVIRDKEPALYEHSYCQGSACMAWVWERYHDPRERHLVRKGTKERINSGTTSNSEWILANPDEPAPPQRGKCGLVLVDSAPKAQP